MSDDASDNAVAAIVAEEERLVLSAEAAEAFLAALVNPPKPNDRLREAFERYKRDVR